MLGSRLGPGTPRLLCAVGPVDTCSLLRISLQILLTIDGLSHCFTDVEIKVRLSHVKTDHRVVEWSETPQK